MRYLSASVLIVECFARVLVREFTWPYQQGFDVGHKFETHDGSGMALPAEFGHECT